MALCGCGAGFDGRVVCVVVFRFATGGTVIVMNEPAEVSVEANESEAPVAGASAQGPSEFQRLPGRGTTLSRSLMSSERQRLYLGRECLLVIIAKT